MYFLLIGLATKIKVTKQITIVFLCVVLVNLCLTSFFTVPFANFGSPVAMGPTFLLTSALLERKIHCLL